VDETRRGSVDTHNSTMIRNVYFLTTTASVGVQITYMDRDK
jgi:hypothetical protein